MTQSRKISKADVTYFHDYTLFFNKKMLYQNIGAEIGRIMPKLRFLLRIFKVSVFETCKSHNL